MRSLAPSEIAYVSGGQDFPNPLPTGNPRTGPQLVVYPPGSIGDRATRICEGLPDSTDISFTVGGGGSVGISQPIELSANHNGAVTVDVNCGDIRAAQKPTKP